MEHAWCRDPSRDERVRAAEDGRDRTLPTLEECIETAFSAGVRDSFRKVEEAWAMIPKSVSASSPVDQENKGDGMGDEIRKQRITLEIECDAIIHSSQWPWTKILRDGGVIGSGESVRVVRDEEREEFPSSCPIAGGTVVVNGEDMVTLSEFLRHTTKLTQEAGVAKRERDELRKSWLRSEESGTRLLAERNAALDAADGLRKRVAELEAASGGNHSPDAGKMVEQEPVACKNCEGAETVWCEHSQQHIGCYCARDTVREDEGQSRVIEVWHESSDPAQAHRARAARLLAEREAAQARAAELEAASGGGEGNGTFFGAGGPFNFQYAEDSFFPRNVHGFLRQCVKIKGAPPQPRGWLTASDRQNLEEIVVCLDDDNWPHSAAFVRSLLARSTPPEVVLPVADCSWCSDYATVWRECLEAVRSSLAAAGVAVKGTT